MAAPGQEGIPHALRKEIWTPEQAGRPAAGQFTAAVPQILRGGANRMSSYTSANTISREG